MKGGHSTIQQQCGCKKTKDPEPTTSFITNQTTFYNRRQRAKSFNLVSPRPHKRSLGYKPRKRCGSVSLVSQAKLEQSSRLYCNNNNNPLYGNFSLVYLYY